VPALYGSAITNVNALSEFSCFGAIAPQLWLDRRRAGEALFVMQLRTEVTMFMTTGRLMLIS
jgi:hypothetical protein